jgi:5-methylcytosine-specific restriction protein A
VERLAESSDAAGEERTAAHRRADALVDVCRHFLDHQRVRIAGRHRPHVNVVVDLPHLEDGHGARSLGGLPVTPVGLKRLLCDANVHRVITAGRSSVLDYGRATRTIPPAVYTSLVLRDLHCRFPGCDRPSEWTEGHHIVPWENGGPTRLDNLVLLCSRHHHLIHHRDWHLKLLPSGVVEVTRPDGQVMSSDPPLLC